MTAFVISNAGGNWNQASAYVANSGFPVAGDTVTATATSGNLTVPTGVNAACASLDFTNYIANFTIASGQILTITSVLKFVSGMTLTAAAASATINLNGTVTYTSGTKTWFGTVGFQGANTYTLGDDCTFGGTCNIGTGSAAITFNGNHFNLTTGGVLNGVTSSTVSGTTVFQFKGTNTWQGISIWTTSINIDSGLQTTSFSGGALVFKTGTLAYVSGTVSAGTSTLSLSGSATLSLGSSAQLNNLTITAAATLTLGADLYVTGTMTLPNAAFTMAGAFNVQVATLTCTSPTVTRIWTFVANQTWTVTTAITNFIGTVSVRLSLVSSSPGTKWKLVLADGATQSMGYVDPTDSDATGGQPLFTFRGTVTTCFNWFSSFPVYRPWPASIRNVGAQTYGHG